MFCNNCGAQLEDDAKFCGNCGAVVEAAPAEPAAPVAPAAPVQPVAPAPVAPVAPVEATPVVPAAPVPETTAAPASSMAVPMPAVPTEAAPATKAAGGFADKMKGFFGSKKGKALGIVAGAVVVVLVLVLCLGSVFSNGLKKLFLSDEKYYQSVEKSEVKELAADLASAYSDLVLSNSDISSQKVNFKASVKVEERGQKILDMADSFGVDLEWLKSAAVNGYFNIKDNMISAEFEGAVNGDTLAGAEFILDMENDAVYGRVPQLSSTYIGAEDIGIMDQMARSLRYSGLGYMFGYGMGRDVDFVDLLTEMTEMEEKLMKALPSEGEVKKLLTKYISLAIEQIDDVKVKDDVTLKSHGVKQDVTEISYTIDDEVVENVLSAILDELENDSKVQDIIDRIAEAVDADFDSSDIMDMIIDQGDELLDEVSRYGIGGEVKYCVYVNSSGDIVGRKIEDENKNTIMELKAPQDGKEIGYEFTLPYMSIGGKGTKSGDKVTGDITFSSPWEGDYYSFDIEDFDVKKLMRGEIDGIIKLSVDEDMARSIGMPRELREMVSRYTLVIDMNASKNKAEVTISVEDKKGKYFTLEMSASTGSGSKVSVPSGKSVEVIESQGDLMDYVEDLDWSKFLKSLRKTIPSDYIDYLEDALDYFM